MYDHRNRWLEKRGITYAEYLLSDHWLEIRRVFWETNLHCCYICGVENQLFNLHHRTYKRIGRERMSDLVILCRDCHAAVHGINVTWWMQLRWLFQPGRWFRRWWARLR